jgi:hypothetical protein
VTAVVLYAGPVGVDQCNDDPDRVAFPLGRNR